ncbi:hypothetical protein C0J52_21302 [Blattella germanica]|nr:hypothetical protein C0J52_21302 [Blattella germanica]
MVARVVITALEVKDMKDELCPIQGSVITALEQGSVITAHEVKDMKDELCPIVRRGDPPDDEGPSDGDGVSGPPDKGSNESAGLSPTDEQTGPTLEEIDPSDGDGVSGPPDNKSNEAADLSPTEEQAGPTLEELELAGPSASPSRMPSCSWSAPSELTQKSSFEQIVFNRKSVNQGSDITALEVKDMKCELCPIVYIPRSISSEESSNPLGATFRLGNVILKKKNKKMISLTKSMSH